MHSVFSLLFLLFLLAGSHFAVSAQSRAETTSRNGYWMPNRDTIRVFLVFAEAVGDPDDQGGEPASSWPRGQMPKNAEEYFDAECKDPSELKSRMTQYFHQASFGVYVILGDYYPELVRIPFKDIKRYGDEQVVDYLEALPEDDIITANGYSFNEDFDNWTIGSGYGRYKEKTPDGLVDFFLIVWRVNSKISTNDNAGSVNVRKWRRPLKGKDGFMDRSRFISRSSSGGGILQHEYSHSLYGGNNFHTGARGAGNASFMHAVGGWSNLSSFGSSSTSWNAWDRHRMGWKPADKEYYISATCASTGKEVSLDLEYGQEVDCPGMEFWLDDFVDRGDALRVRLPYVQTDNPSARRQYLWLENHRMRPGRIDHHPDMTKGVYAFIQVGKSDTSDFGGPGLYTTPLNGYGHYDFDIDPKEERLYQWRERENPFTGIHFTMIPAMNSVEPNVVKDRNGDTVSVHPDEIWRGETVYIKGVLVKGTPLPESDFHYKTHTCLGTVHDAFVPGDIISISDNPAPVNVLTWETRSSRRVSPYPTPRAGDSRQIWLNGIRIELLEEDSKGRMKIKLDWQTDPLTGSKNRWCGPLNSVENIEVAAKSTLLIDLGLSATKPVNPLKFRKSTVFADTTYLRLRNGATLFAGEDAVVRLRWGSKLILETGSILDLGSGARLIVEEGASVMIEEGASLKLATGARVYLKDPDSWISLESGSSLSMDSKSCLEISNGAKLTEKGAQCSKAGNARIRLKNAGIYRYSNEAPEGLKCSKDSALEPWSGTQDK